MDRDDWPAAYVEGRKASWAGKGFDDNPYAKGTPDHGEWCEGWNDASESRWIREAEFEPEIPSRKPGYDEWLACSD